MNIIAKAKPIRFRIVSGGRECDSLEALHENFVFKDIQQIVADGRFCKWLHSLHDSNATIIEKKLSVQQANNLSIQSLLNILFPNKYERKSRETKIEFLSRIRENAPENVFHSLLIEYKSNDTEVIKWCLGNSLLDLKELKDDINIASNQEKLYSYGIYLFDNKNTQQKALDLLSLLKEAGYSKAIDFINKLEKNNDSKCNSSPIINSNTIPNNNSSHKNNKYLIKNKIVNVFEIIEQSRSKVFTDLNSLIDFFDTKNYSKEEKEYVVFIYNSLTLINHCNQKGYKNIEKTLQSFYHYHYQIDIPYVQCFIGLILLLTQESKRDSFDYFFRSNKLPISKQLINNWMKIYKGKEIELQGNSTYTVKVCNCPPSLIRFKDFVKWYLLDAVYYIENKCNSLH